MLGLTMAAALCFHALLSASSTPPPPPRLAEFALQQALEDASPILGHYRNVQSNTSTWMSRVRSDTAIVHMNIPGTHDSSTWNYSQATQNALLPITDLNGVIELPPEIFRCQQRPFVDMLDAGIRAFDLRYAFDATNTSLVFYHGPALQSERATATDVLFGFYQWLADHPSEALFLSFMYESGTKANAADDAAVQTAIFTALTSPAARRYIVQAKDALGTLGDARGKITLLRRFDLNALPASYTDALPGLHFSPAGWIDNGPDFNLTYNTAKNLTAYIEDFYEMDSPVGSPATLNIQWKYNATTAHLLKAAEARYRNSLFWSFASSEYDVNLPPDTPRIQALGNGTKLTPMGGVNQKLIPFLKGLGKGKRLGIVMFDFYDQPGDLVQTFLDVA